MKRPCSDRLVDWGVATRALPGQGVSGDLHLVEPCDSGVLLAVVDGLGHGAEANRAAELAVKALRGAAEESVHTMVNRCHEALKNTRGVVMTVAWLDAEEETITWLGVGNVDGVLFRANPEASPACEHVLLRGGVVGTQLPSLYAGVLPLVQGDLLVLASDGIRNDFEGGVSAKAAPQAIADQLMARYFKGTDDALVLVARYAGCGP